MIKFRILYVKDMEKVKGFGLTFNKSLTEAEALKAVFSEIGAFNTLTALNITQTEGNRLLWIRDGQPIEQPNQRIYYFSSATE